MARRRDLQLDVLVNALDRGLGAVAAQIEAVAARLEALDRKVARPRVEVDTDKAERDIGRFASDLEKRIGRAVKALPKIELTSDTDPLTRQLQSLRGELVQLSRQRVGIDVDADEAFAEIQRISAELTALSRNRGATIQVRTDAGAALAELAAVKAAAESLDDSDVELEIRGGKSIRDWINGVSLLTRSLRTLVFPVAFLGALPTIVTMAGAVGQLTGVVGLLPGALLGVGSAIGAVVLGFQGFGDAVSAVKPEKLAEALAALAPNARDSAVAVRGLADSWKTVQAAVQQNLFAGVATQIQQIGSSYIPVLRTGLSGVASSLNSGAQSWAEWAAGAEAVRDLGRIFEGARAGIDQLAPAARDVAAALTDIGVVSTSMFPRLAAGASDAAGMFRDFIAQARETGQLEMWIQRGVDALTSLGRSTGNIISTLGGLSDAAEQAVGGTFLAKLEAATQRMDEFVNSVDGQDRLISFFSTIQGAVDAILPGLQSLGSSTLDAFNAAGPSAELFAGSISSIATSLAPALPLVASLTSVIAVLAGGLAGLVSVLGPIPALVLGIVAAFRLLGTVGALMGTVLTAASTGLTRIATTSGVAVLGLTNSAKAGQAVTTTMGRLAGAFSSAASFLAGPWGAALLVAGGALTYFATQGARQAEERLAAVKAEAESLQSTLNQLTGGITDATVAQRAHNLAFDDYNNTGKSTIETARQFGLAANTVTQASLGNAESLRNVNTALVEHVTGIVQSNTAYQQLEPTLTRMGISAEDLARAFVDGGAAQDALMGRLDNLGPGLQGLVSQLDNGTQGAQQFAEQMQFTSAALQQTIDRTIQAAAGAINYGSTLQAASGAMEQFSGALDKNTGSIIQGAEGAQQLSTALQATANDATTLAQAAGIAAAANGDLAAGSDAAAESMKQSRQAFIEMAVQAGLGAIEADRLANSLGLLESVARVQFEMRGLPEAQQQVGELLARMQALPAQTTFVVDALTQDAVAKLEALGFQVQQLGDGTYQITVTDNSEKTRANLQALLDLGLSLPEAIKLLVSLDGGAEVEAEIERLRAKVESLRQLTNQQGGRIGGISFDTSEGNGQLDALEQRLRNFGNETIPMPQFEPPKGQTLQAAFGFDKLDPVRVPVEADTGTFATAADLLALIGALLVPVDADTAPAAGKLDGLLALLRALIVPPVPVDADTAPAAGKLDTLLALLLSLIVPPIPVPLDTGGAVTGLNGLLDLFGGLRTQPPIPVPLDTTGADTRMASLRTSIDGLRTMPAIPLNLDSAAASTALANLRIAIDAIRNLPPIPMNLDTTAASAAVAAVRAAILALNSLNTTAHHTQTDNVAQLVALINTLNSAHTTAQHTQTDNVADVLASINTLNSAHTTSSHTVSDNVDAVLARLNSLNGHNTESTHTVTTVHRTVQASGGALLGARAGSALGSAAGGGVVRGFARGGILPGFAPGKDRIPAMLSPGESVLTPEATRLLGAKAILGLNKMASGRKGAVLGRGSLPSSGGSISGGLVTGYGGNSAAVERKLDELITVMRARDGVTVNVTGSPVGDPAETAQATKLALHTL